MSFKLKWGILRKKQIPDWGLTFDHDFDMVQVIDIPIVHILAIYKSLKVQRTCMSFKS